MQPAQVPFAAPGQRPQAGLNLGTAGVPRRRAMDGILNDMAAASVRLGHDIVDIVGFLDGVNLAAGQQISQLTEAGTGAREVSTASTQMVAATDRLAEVMRSLMSVLGSSTQQLAQAVQSSQQVISWVSGVGGQLARIDEAVRAAQNSNTRILDIAREVNMLAINAKIEAARAGTSGRGFAVVADAINTLSTQTAEAARTISTTVGSLACEIGTLQAEADVAVAHAGRGLKELASAEMALTTLGGQAAAGGVELDAMGLAAGQMQAVVRGFGPTFAALHDGVTGQVAQVAQVHSRVSGLIRLSEQMIQHMFALGGATEDELLIEDVKARANALGAALTTAVERREIALSALFSGEYRTVAGSNPTQVIAPFTALTDRLFTPIQEAALAGDSRIVFCAAVNRDGYLPTHNLKFSAPQGADPVWNAANCRNRRIFDDRVGLGAGRSVEPFLMQIYRRDMGGGKFVLMKDVSAPIFVAGRHWGGLRLAFGF